MVCQALRRDESLGLHLYAQSLVTFLVSKYTLLREAQVWQTPGYKSIRCYSATLLAHPPYYRIRWGPSVISITATINAVGDRSVQFLGPQSRSHEIDRGLRSPLTERNGDLAKWHTIGMTHKPRVENWPVMPTEGLTVTLKPVSSSSATGYWRCRSICRGILIVCRCRVTQVTPETQHVAGFGRSEYNLAIWTPWFFLFFFFFLSFSFLFSLRGDWNVSPA